METINQAETFTIGQVAKLKNVSPDTLRYYDKLQLFPKITRDKNGIRHFTQEDLQWFDIIKCLKETGMPLDQIKSFVDASHQGNETLASRIGLLQKQISKIQVDIALKQQYLAKIKQKITTLGKAGGKLNKSRIEAYTDAVIAIILTIMILEFEIPDSPN